MALDLPVATRQPYDSKNPWYDVSQYLSGGLTPYAARRQVVCVTGQSSTPCLSWQGRRAKWL